MSKEKLIFGKKIVSYLLTG